MVKDIITGTDASVGIMCKNTGVKSIGETAFDSFVIENMRSFLHAMPPSEMQPTSNSFCLNPDPLKRRNTRKLNAIIAKTGVS